MKQIRVSKETASASAKRDSYKIAAEQCNVFAEKIIKLQSDFDGEVGLLKNKIIDKFDIVIGSDGIDVKLKEELSQCDLNKIYKSKNLRACLQSHREA